MPKISQDLLNSYFTTANRHPVFSDTVKLYEALRVHADGDFPKEMIEARRPSETEEILAYRRKTYKAITKLPVSKVLTSLSKIRRSPDWAIIFDEKATPAKIAKGESLQEYINGNIPGFGSITDWLFSVLLKQNAIDANAVVAVIPLKPIEVTEYCKPVPIVFNSDHVIEYSEERQFAILKSKRKVNLLLEDGSTNYNAGDRFYYIDDNEVIIYDQTKDGFSPVFQQPHKLGRMPAFKVRGEAFKQYDNMVVNRSRLDAMVPFLDEAACEYSDLKGSKIQHLYPLFWFYQNKNCGTCNGTGKVTGKEGATTCSKCDGGGKVKFSPYAHIEVTPPALGAAAIPFATPAGYVTRDTAILELQEKSVEKNNYKALAAINMQFLDQTPLNISGEAKNVDREELNNFVYNFAEDLVYSADRTNELMCDWRYIHIVPDAAERKAMLPKIPVPQNFDLLPSEYLVKEITDARTAKVNPLLIGTLEVELATKKFYNNPSLSDAIKTLFLLDPLPGITVDEKMSLISNKAITQEDFVISAYMAQFIKRAIIEDKNFCKKPYEKQMEVLKRFADEKIKANDEAQAMIDKEREVIVAEMGGGKPGEKSGEDGEPGQKEKPQPGKAAA